MDQLQAELIDDTAAQLTTARGNERLTATLTDTMHEDTQVMETSNFHLFILHDFLVSTAFIWYSLSCQSNRSRSPMCIFGFIKSM